MEEGKLGVCVFLFHYAQYFQDQHIFDIAYQILENIIEEINIHEAITIRRGLAGYGYGIASLIAAEIIDIDDSDVLSDIDDNICNRVNEVESFSNSDGLLGIGRYLALAAVNGIEASIDHSRLRDMLLQISNRLFFEQIIEEDVKYTIEFLSNLIKLNINRIESQKKLFDLIKNYPSINGLPSVLLENYRNTKLDYLKIVAELLKINSRAEFTVQ